MNGVSRNEGNFTGGILKLKKIGEARKFGFKTGGSVREGKLPGSELGRKERKIVERGIMDLKRAREFLINVELMGDSRASSRIIEHGSSPFEQPRLGRWCVFAA